MLVVGITPRWVKVVLYILVRHLTSGGRSMKRDRACAGVGRELMGNVGFPGRSRIPKHSLLRGSA